MVTPLSLILLSAMLLLPAVVFAAEPPKLTGQWDVAQALMPHSLSPQQLTMRENDPRLMSRTLVVGTDHVNFQRYEPDCAMSPMVGGNKVSMRMLFAKERGLKRPAAMKGLLFGRAADYDLGNLKGRRVNLWHVNCKRHDGVTQPFANWFAVSANLTGKPTTLLFPKSNDALLLMQQTAPHTDAPDATLAEFCKQASSASDKAICENAPLLRLLAFISSARARIVSDRPDFNAGIESLSNEQLKNREACNGDVICLYEALDRQLFILGMNMTR